MIWETIKARAKTNGDKLASVCHDKQYTYKELVESIEKLIAILSTVMSPWRSFILPMIKNIIT